MKSKLFIFYIVLSVFLGSGITSIVLYVNKISPLQRELDEKKEEARDKLIRDCGFDVYIAVSLREVGQEKTLQSFDEKILPSDIQVLFKFYNESYIGSKDSLYLLWRIKKYSKDFSIAFPKKEMEILNNISDKRPTFSGKIGDE